MAEVIHRTIERLLLSSGCLSLSLWTGVLPGLSVSSCWTVEKTNGQAQLLWRICASWGHAIWQLMQSEGLMGGCVENHGVRFQGKKLKGALIPRCPAKSRLGNGKILRDRPLESGEALSIRAPSDFTLCTYPRCRSGLGRMRLHSQRPLWKITFA